VSPKLLDELARTLDRSKFRRCATHEDVRMSTCFVDKPCTSTIRPLSEVRLPIHATSTSSLWHVPRMRTCSSGAAHLMGHDDARPTVLTPRVFLERSNRAPDVTPRDERLELDHVLIATPDLEAAAAELDDRYGLTNVPGGRHPRWSTANRIVPLGDTYLELVAVVHEPCRSRSELVHLRSSS
jgi:Glyoxalase-like domain